MGRYYNYAGGRLSPVDVEGYYSKYSSICDNEQLSYRLETVIKSQERLLKVCDDPIYKDGWNFIRLLWPVSELDPSREEPSGTTYFMINSVSGIVYEVNTYLHYRDTIELEDDLWHKDVIVNVDFFSHKVEVNVYDEKFKYPVSHYTGEIDFCEHKLYIVGNGNSLFNLHQKKLESIRPEILDALSLLGSLQNSLSAVLM